MTSALPIGRDPAAATESADHPGEVSVTGWVAVAKRVAARVKSAHVVLNSAGVAFFGFLSTIPAMIALVSVYGLVADPDAIERRVEDLAAGLPEEARQLLVQQLEGITSASGGALGLGLAVSLLVALGSRSEER